MDVDPFGDRIVFLVVERLAQSVIAGNHNAEALVVLEGVVKYFDLVRGHHDNAGARRNGSDGVALGSKVFMVIGEDLVLEDAHAPAVLDLQARQIEDQKAAGVVGGRVFVDIGVAGVLNFNVRDITLGPATPNNDVL